MIKKEIKFWDIIESEKDMFESKLDEISNLMDEAKKKHNEFYSDDFLPNYINEQILESIKYHMEEEFGFEIVPVIEEPGIFMVFFDPYGGMNNDPNYVSPPEDTKCYDFELKSMFKKYFAADPEADKHAWASYLRQIADDLES